MITMDPPALTDALCAGHWPWWDDHIDGESDEDRAERHAAAVRVCSRCPVIEPCRRWGARYPRARYGVWAGKVHIERPRARKSTPEMPAKARTHPTVGEPTRDAATAA